jgi:hypothetical protein
VGFTSRAARRAPAQVTVGRRVCGLPAGRGQLRGFACRSARASVPGRLRRRPTRSLRRVGSFGANPMGFFDSRRQPTSPSGPTITLHCAAGGAGRRGSIRCRSAKVAARHPRSAEDLRCTELRLSYRDFGDGKPMTSDSVSRVTRSRASFRAHPLSIGRRARGWRRCAARARIKRPPADQREPAATDGRPRDKSAPLRRRPPEHCAGGNTAPAGGPTGRAAPATPPGRDRCACGETPGAELRPTDDTRDRGNQRPVPKGLRRPFASEPDREGTRRFSRRLVSRVDI